VVTLAKSMVERRCVRQAPASLAAHQAEHKGAGSDRQWCATPVMRAQRRPTVSSLPMIAKQRVAAQGLARGGASTGPQCESVFTNRQHHGGVVLIQ
jgi:hypothetical protein